jgi:hypothetical protein
MEKNMGKLSDAAPYLAVAALAATGVGLAGAGAAAGAGAGTAAAAGGSAAGALGATGTQTGLALGSTLGTSAAVAPEAAFLASLGGSAPLATPLATKAATTTYPFMGGKGSILSKPEALQIGSGYEGVTHYGSPYGTGSNVLGTPSTVSPNYIPQLDTSYADILKPKGDYAFMGGSGSPEWSALSNQGLTNYAIEDGTKTLMDQLGLGYGDALNLATQFYSSGNNQANNNASYYNPNNVVSTRRNYEPRPAMSYEIMRRNMRPSKTISSYG